MDPRTYSPPADLLRDRIVLITGASDGIGKAVALAAAAHGATVILHGRNVRRLEAVYDSIVGAGQPRPSILPLDFERAGPSEYDQLAVAANDSTLILICRIVRMLEAVYDSIVGAGHP